jgi:hypothetical protein
MVNIKESGISTASLLGIVFIVLKLTHYIDWSWLWVLSPFWIPVSIFLGVMLVYLLIILIILIKFSINKIKE